MASIEQQKSSFDKFEDRNVRILLHPIDVETPCDRRLSIDLPLQPVIYSYGIGCPVAPVDDEVLIVNVIFTAQFPEPEIPFPEVVSTQPEPVKYRKVGHWGNARILRPLHAIRLSFPHDSNLARVKPFSIHIRVQRIISVRVTTINPQRYPGDVPNGMTDK